MKAEAIFTPLTGIFVKITENGKSTFIIGYEKYKEAEKVANKLNSIIKEASH
jgi:hypothetical protein